MRFSLGDEPAVSDSGTDERSAGLARDLAAALGIGPERIRVAPLRASLGYDDGLAGDGELTPAGSMARRRPRPPGARLVHGIRGALGRSVAERQGVFRRRMRRPGAGRSC